MTDHSIGLTFVIGQWQIWIHFEPRYLYVGVVWEREPEYLEINACIIPSLPIRFLRLTPGNEEVEA